MSYLLQAPFLRMYKDYSVTVEDGIKQISELDPKKKPLLYAYLEDKRNAPVCKGLDFGTFLTSPIKSIYPFMCCLTPRDPTLSPLA